jgi:proteasome subunit B (beta)-like protein
MTAIVGIRCKDGIVIGSDSSATFGNQLGLVTIEQSCKKVDVICDQVILSGTGAGGLHQRFREVVTKYWTDKKYHQPNGSQNKSPFEISKELSIEGIKDFASTHANAGQYGALVAFPAGGTFHLCEFAIKDFQPEFKEGKIWFASMGSCQQITDPFLGMIRRVFWESDEPNLRGGIFAVTWTLDHVIKLNPGGINGPAQIGVLEAKNNAYLLGDKIQEHLSAVQSVEEPLGKFRDFLSGAGAKPMRFPIAQMPTYPDIPFRVMERRILTLIATWRKTLSCLTELLGFTASPIKTVWCGRGDSALPVFEACPFQKARVGPSNDPNCAFWFKMVKDVRFERAFILAADKFGEP